MRSPPKIFQYVVKIHIYVEPCSSNVCCSSVNCIFIRGRALRVLAMGDQAGSEQSDGGPVFPFLERPRNELITSCLLDCLIKENEKKNPSSAKEVKDIICLQSLIIFKEMGI